LSIYVQSNTKSRLVGLHDPNPVHRDEDDYDNDNDTILYKLYHHFLAGWRPFFSAASFSCALCWNGSIPLPMVRVCYVRFDQKLASLQCSLYLVSLSIGLGNSAVHNNNLALKLKWKIFIITHASFTVLRVQAVGSCSVTHLISASNRNDYLPTCWVRMYTNPIRPPAVTSLCSTRTPDTMVMDSGLLATLMFRNARHRIASQQ
jgi:hypothetical protein